MTPAQTLREALHATLGRLESAEIPEAPLEAEYLVAEAAGIPRLQLPLRTNAVLGLEAERRLQNWTLERLERRPLAYVLGTQPFMNLTLKVNPSVLIPRPETELLVEKTLHLLDERNAAIVVDVGTGSGNIALSLAPHPHAVEIHAVDISEAALELARENAVLNQVEKTIHWHGGDLLTPLKRKRVRADIIVANLPYVRTDEMPDLPPEVRWEPALALEGGRDGLAYISLLVEQAEDVLKPGGILLLEIGAEQGKRVLRLFKSRALWKNVELTRDLAGLPRMVQAQRGGDVGSSND